MMNISDKKIVCLGGGIGTSNLIKGLKHYASHLTVITSMADDGGSSGRLRKAYNIMPPGDIVSCIAALILDDQQELRELLLHRFPGNNNTNKAIDGHKLGNLIMLAEIQRTGDFYKALAATKKLFGVTADIFPATDERTHLNTVTKDGSKVHTENTIDLALYSEPRGLKKVYIKPKEPKVNPKVISSILNADVIISGPGDLYTNQLPVMIIPQIKKALLESQAKKIFVLNVTNKPFETKGFSSNDFITAIADHLGIFPFGTIIANNNHEVPIPKKYKYKYVSIDKTTQKNEAYRLVTEDLIDESFPLYHNTKKLAKAVIGQI